jgi:leader peptidase (prepilin peptidase)/N-methyltransferase
LVLLGRVFEAAGFVVFLTGTALLALVDARTMRLPNRVLYPAMWAGLVLLAGATVCSGEWSRLAVALASAAVTVAVFFTLYKASSLGRGDVRLSGLLALFLGWFGPAVVFAGLALGTVIGGVVGAVFLAWRGGRGRILPYGPFLVLGAWLALARVVA